MKKNVNVKLKLNLILYISSLLIVGTFYQNCGKSNPSFQDNYLENPSLAMQTQAVKVLTARCQTCHNSVQAMGGVAEIADPEYTYNQRLILPTEPELSPILQVALGESVTHPSLEITTDEITDIKNWITNLDPTLIGSGKAPVTIPLGPTFASIQANILLAKCDGCHQLQKPNVRFQTYMQTLTSIKPGDPGQSSLLNRVKGIGNIMPKPESGFGPLSKEEIDALTTWIVNGAKND